MPELPEVETTRLSLLPHLLNQRIATVIVRDARLRWPITAELVAQSPGMLLHAIERRAKYLLFKGQQSCLIIHLGMSGSLRVLPASTPPGKHDHADIVFDNHICLRLHDPRRFGALLWTDSDPLTHPLLKNLGPEPLAADFNGRYLYQRSRGRSLAIKHFIMDSQVLSGVGNIYASEALFLAGIHPARQSGRIAEARYECLATAIKQVLLAALQQGGTTLRDFVSDGQPGYFKPRLNVYGRELLPCNACGQLLELLKQGQRSSYYCKACQH